MKIQTLISVFTLSIVVTGCQTIPKAPVLPTTPPQQPNTETSPIQQFQITGKIGVRTPEQNGSAFYGWTQNGKHFAIDLTGAMGIGQTSIRGVPGHVTLTSSKTGTIEADTPEELLFQATKWEAPITYLISWINAQPAQSQATVTQDTQQRPQTIHEGGWLATLNYKENEKLPNKLVLVDDAQQNRVTLTIQTRE